MVSEQLKELWELAFGDSREMVDCFFRTAYDPSRCRFLKEGDSITAALYWLDCYLAGEKYAYIYAVATHPDHRGKGLCRALMSGTHAHLKAEGYAGAVLKPGEEGLRKMYAAMGYRDCSRLGEKEITAGEESIPVRTLDPEEYAARRRALLPEGGLIQEGANIAYLATYAGLYAAGDTIFAAVHGEDHLFLTELLGDPALAPKILKAMGYGSGTCRIPGEDIPFAMYLPLQEDAPMPTYLGFAFD